MTKILIDHHHDALRYSLQLLFEKRLGWEVYTQVGMEWYPEWWNIHPHINTASQFLSLNHIVEPPKDVHGNALPPSAILNAVNYHMGNGIYQITDPVRDRPYMGITLEAFKNTKFDVLLCSMPQHIPIWLKLRDAFHPNAAIIFQAGNNWHNIDPRIKNLLSSTLPHKVPDGVNAVFYCQEFDLDVYKYEPPTQHTNVYSFIHYLKKPELMRQVADHLPGWNFTSYGAGQSESICKSVDVASKMREMSFYWYYKPESDGWGHSLHGAYACGRPAITNLSHHKGKRPSNLFEDQITCIDMDKHGVNGTIEQLKYWSQPDNHKQMCENAYNRFKEVVNYDKEEEDIRRFIERLR